MDFPPRTAHFSDHQWLCERCRQVWYNDLDWGDGSGWSEGIEDYWHYWTSDSADSAWDFSMIGADARTVSDGSMDGWVFLSPDAPQALPAPGAIALLAIGFAGRRRRR